MHREKGLEIMKRARELRGTMKRWCVDMTGVPGGTDTSGQRQKSRFERLYPITVSK